MKRGVLALAVVVTAASAEAQGTISGCVATDVASGQFVVTVTATSATVRRETHTDRNGCYRFNGLPEGSYTVTASSNLPKLRDSDTVVVPARGKACSQRRNRRFP